MELNPSFDPFYRVPLGGWTNPHTRHSFKAIHFLAGGGLSHNFIVVDSQGRVAALKHCIYPGDGVLNKTSYYNEDCNLQYFRSPHIVSLIESWLIPGELESGEGFFVTEYCHLGSLFDFAGKYFFSEAKLIDALAHICLGLSRLHQHSLGPNIHRYSSCLSCFSRGYLNTSQYYFYFPGTVYSLVLLLDDLIQGGS